MNATGLWRLCDARDGRTFTDVPFQAGGRLVATDGKMVCRILPTSAEERAIYQVAPHHGPHMTAAIDNLLLLPAQVHEPPLDALTRWAGDPAWWRPIWTDSWSGRYARPALGLVVAAGEKHLVCRQRVARLLAFCRESRVLIGATSNTLIARSGAWEAAIGWIEERRPDMGPQPSIETLDLDPWEIR